MSYQEVYNIYSELGELLKQKHDAIIKKDIEMLNKLDEEILVLCEKTSKLDIQNKLNSFDDKEKEKLKKLVSEIKSVEENNEILIKHSLNVINGILSGILNIAQKDKCAYNSKGKTLGDSESMNISSITEEA